MRTMTIIDCFLMTLLLGCGSREIRPIDIYPEDMCAHCRMAVSDQRFAAEFVTADREVFKFDDIGCLESFRKEHADILAAAVFVKDYELKVWLPDARATIVRAGVTTPMASGKVAFADSAKAIRFVTDHPVPATASEKGKDECCEEEG